MRAHILLNGGSLLRSRKTSPCPGRERRSRRWCCALTVRALVSVCVGAAPRVETSWRDIEARIQYGYYTEDASALRSLEDTVAADESHDKLHGYYAALLAWRLAQLAVQRPSTAPGASAAQLAQRCVSELDEALAVAEDFAEGLALRGACLATQAERTHAAHAARRVRGDIGRALRLAGRDPRVVFIDAPGDYQLAPGLGGHKGAPPGKLRPGGAAIRALPPGPRHLARCGG